MSYEDYFIDMYGVGAEDKIEQDLKIVDDEYMTRKRLHWKRFIGPECLWCGKHIYVRDKLMHDRCIDAKNRCSIDSNVRHKF